MLNGLLTFYYGALNFRCYYGDSTPGGEAGVNRGIGHGECPAPLSGLGVFACIAGATSFCRAAAFAVFVRHTAEGGVEPTGEKVACDFTEMPRRGVPGNPDSPGPNGPGPYCRTPYLPSNQKYLGKDRGFTSCSGPLNRVGYLAITGLVNAIAPARLF
jgi:hypothetical protein